MGKAKKKIRIPEHCPIYPEPGIRPTNVCKKV
jgi:hypothetical protein